ncbi:MAG: malonyl-ACP O-methyltransferase BioC [Marinomonas sp.]
MQTPNDSEHAFHYKRQVAQRFDRAALTYDAYADFQRIVLDRLLTFLPSVDANTVLDLGTGTGQALSKLVQTLSPSLPIALDLSFQMLEKARSQQGNDVKPSFVCADAERLPFADNTFDVIFSSLAMQWCLNTAALFSELYRTTKPGGFAVFSTLCEGSMPEIDAAWKGIDQAPHVNQYPNLNTLLDAVIQCHWRPVNTQLVTLPMWFESPEGAIHSLKKVGASLVVTNNKNTVTPTKWKAFINQYEQLREAKGIPLRYQVAFVVLQKPYS